MGKAGLAGYSDQTIHHVCDPENLFLPKFPEDKL
jgi:hypothetical protein